jgi:hypothetical protein
MAKAKKSRKRRAKHILFGATPASHSTEAGREIDAYWQDVKRTVSFIEKKECGKAILLYGSLRAHEDAVKRELFYSTTVPRQFRLSYVDRMAALSGTIYRLLNSACTRK